MNVPFEGMSYVFVSYSHKDSGIVIPIIKDLASVGVRVWHDGDLPYVNDYNEIIDEAIKNCSLFIVFLSENSANSQYVRSEVYHALNKEKNVAVALLESFELPSGLDMRISHINRVEREKLGEEAFFEKICEVCTVEKCRGARSTEIYSAGAIYCAKKESEEKRIIHVIDSVAMEKRKEIEAERERIKRELAVDFTETGSQDESIDSKNIKIRTAPDVKRGDTYIFGRYPQSDTSPEPIEWKVVAVYNEKALVISRYALDNIKYNEKEKNVTWETCSLRKWLNSSFFEAAFNNSEQSKIRVEIIQNDNNQDYDTQGGACTKDRIFCLSIEQAQTLSLKESIGVSTKYAESHGALNGTCRWWLRSPGKSNVDAAYVSVDGTVDTFGNYVSIGRVSVRPSFFINLEDFRGLVKVK